MFLDFQMFLGGVVNLYIILLKILNILKLMKKMPTLVKAGSLVEGALYGMV